MQIRTRVHFTSLRSSRGYELAPMPPGPKSTYGEARMRMKFGRSVPASWLTWLRPRGPEDVATQPLDNVGGLFKRFADLPYDPSAYQAFCSNWGLLSPVRFFDFSHVSFPPKDNQTIPFSTQSLILSVAGFHSIVRSSLGLTIRAEPPYVASFRNQQTKIPLEADRFAPASLLDGRYFLSDPLAHLEALVSYGMRIGTETDQETNFQTFV